jgi:serine/threonine protein kinase
MKQPTSKVDIWALGLILYQLLTSKHPFMRSIPVQTLKAIEDEDPDPLPETISNST